MTEPLQPLELGHIKEDRRDQYETIWHLHEQGFSYDDIAGHMHLTRGQVSGVLHRLRRHNASNRFDTSPRNPDRQEPYLSEFLPKRSSMYTLDRGDK